MQSPPRFSGQNTFLLLVTDCLCVFLAFLIALSLRFDGWIPLNYVSAFLVSIPFIGLLYCLINYLFGLYAHLWRYAGAQEVISIFGAVAVSSAMLGMFMLILGGRRSIPLSVVIMGGVFVAGGFMAIRYQNRLFTGFMGRLQRIVGSPNRSRVLVIGAGESGQFLAWQMKTGQQRHQYELVGFIDDDSQKWGLRLHGLPVLGGRHAIPALVTERSVGLIVIAIHNIAGPDMREILTLCMATNTRVKRLPDVLARLDNLAHAELLKDITPVDLLGRQPYQIDQAACSQLLSAKVVLVSGAAGSIGSELCRQILTFNPRQLLLLDNNESGLYDLLVSLSHCQAPDEEVQYGLPENIVPVIADVRDQVRIRQIFKQYSPQIVFHAAAYKHVPLMEQQPEEAVQVNIKGTKIVSQAAIQYGVERFVLVSTDKAINPSSVMGATKRLAEILITHSHLPENQGHTGATNSLTNGSHPPLVQLEPAASRGCLFTAVRFGNVLDSRGSVVPTFTWQIEMGGPVTITHPEMTRYFITIPEAVSLVIQAATLTQGADIFMLDMGQEIKIVDLAHKIIRLRGLRPGKDIQIEMIGKRPGEKLKEELLGVGETRQPTIHPKIYRIQPDNQGYYRPDLHEQITQLIKLACRQQHDQMVALLWQLVKTDQEPIVKRTWN